MLALSRKLDQEIVIRASNGEEFRVRVIGFPSSRRVTLGISAPDPVMVMRGELPLPAPLTPALAAGTA